MKFNEVVALLRATAHLHPSGDPDPHLIEALTRLLVTEQVGEPFIARHKKHPADTAQNFSKSTEAHVNQGGAGTVKSGTSRAPTPRSSRPQNLSEGEQLIAIDSELMQISKQAGLEMEYRDSAPQESPEGIVQIESQTAASPVEDLFPVRRVRAIIREFATLPMPSGRLDLQAIVKLIACGGPIQRMPQSLATALPHSILWLFESGPSMLPFSRDKQQLARTIVRLLGEDRIRIADFIADPLKGVRPRGQVYWLPMYWPSRYSAIVVVSDLDIGNYQMIEGFSLSVWMTFLEEADRRGISTVLLNPYEQNRWPSVSSSFDTALTWDTATGVQALRHTRRLGKGKH